MDILKSNVVIGIGAVVAAAVVAPVVLPLLANTGRPLLKSLVKGGMQLFEKTREAVARAGESVEDMMAEIRAEEAAAVAVAQAGKPATEKTPVGVTSHPAEVDPA